MMNVPIKDIGFVGIQLALFLCYLFDLLNPINFPRWLAFGGIVLAIVGVIVTIIALLQLNRDLSPFPTPKSGSGLRTVGLYALVRHPIYTGIILMTIGYAVYKESLWKLIIAGLLVLLFHFKSKYEEALLTKKFEDYQRYQRTTGRLWPKIF